MMIDMLRAAQIVPEFRAALAVHLVEVSPVLERSRSDTLGPLDVPLLWHRSLDDVPEGPPIVVANEFFDALPVQQAVKRENGWHERRIGIDDEGKLAFTLADGTAPAFRSLLPAAVRAAPVDSIFEWRGDNAAIDLGRRVADSRGAALVIDYGHADSAVGDTLQAVGQHAYADPLTAPGGVDLTAHVDFRALIHTMEAIGATSLRTDRAVRIPAPAWHRNARRHAQGQGTSRRQPPRSTPRWRASSVHGRTGMGTLFKAAAFAHRSIGAPPAFEI